MNNYEAYKKTDIPWLGKIPSHWEIKRVKRFFYIFKDISYKKNPVVLSLARDKVKIRDIESNKGQLAENYNNYNSVKKGDLLLNPMDLYSGANCNISNYDGVISPAYINLRSNKDISVNFFDYIFKLQYTSLAFQSVGKGVSKYNRWTLSNETLLNYQLPIPPISEQIQIANYLDWKINEIDKLILIEKEQIKELENLKQKYIDEIYQNIKSKNFISLSKIGTFFKGGGFSRENLSDSDYGAILYGDIYTKYNYFFEECISKIDENAYFNSKCIDGNVVLFTGSGETKEDIGKSVAYVGTKKIALGGDIIALKPNKNFSPKFIAYFSNTSNIKAFKHMESTGDIIVHITLGAIKSIKIPFITIEEQKDIIKKIDEYILNLKNLIALIEDKIKYFLSLKQSLIAEVVTGKIDVRNITIPQYEKVETIFETDNIDETEVQDYGD